MSRVYICMHVICLSCAGPALGCWQTTVGYQGAHAHDEVIEAAFSALGKELEDFDLGTSLSVPCQAYGAFRGGTHEKECCARWTAIDTRRMCKNRLEKHIWQLLRWGRVFVYWCCLQMRWVSCFRSLWTTKHVQTCFIWVAREVPAVCLFQDFLRDHAFMLHVHVH